MNKIPLVITYYQETDLLEFAYVVRCLKTSKVGFKICFCIYFITYFWIFSYLFDIVHKLTITSFTFLVKYKLHLY